MNSVRTVSHAQPQLTQHQAVASMHVASKESTALWGLLMPIVFRLSHFGNTDQWPALTAVA